MAKLEQKYDVVIAGEHPSAHLLATLLREKSSLSVLLCDLTPAEENDRLVFVNPAFFELHPDFKSLRRKLDFENVYGLQFLGETAAQAGQYRDRAIVGLVGRFSEIHQAITKVPKNHDVQTCIPSAMFVSRTTDGGVELVIDSQVVEARILATSTPLPIAGRRMLGIPNEPELGVMQKCELATLKRSALTKPEARPMIPMALTLGNTDARAWMLTSAKTTQLGVAGATTQPLMPKWIEVLKRHGVIKPDCASPLESVREIAMPLAGALIQEQVYNHTILIGPAGGFFSGWGEDIYPNCWSAIFAADVLSTAFKERHLQDGLAAFRSLWRTTLGEYLRQGQQELRLLLPLIYRNKLMAQRVGQSILLGKGVVVQ